MLEIISFGIVAVVALFSMARNMELLEEIRILNSELEQTQESHNEIADYADYLFHELESTNESYGNIYSDFQEVMTLLTDRELKSLDKRLSKNDREIVVSELNDGQTIYYIGFIVDEDEKCADSNCTSSK